jgi:hypothetical protein
MKLSVFKWKFIVPALLLSQGVTAQTSSSQLRDDYLQRLNTITTAVPFLLITPDSRAGGMGETGVATSPDANSMHWNPAKYAFIDQQAGVSTSYTPWLRQLVDDINLAYLSGYYKLSKDQTIAASLRYFSLGTITFTDINGAVIRNYKPNELGFDVAYSRKLSEHFSGGIALRYVFSNLTGGTFVSGAATKPGQAVAADVSGYYYKPDVQLGDKTVKVGVGFNISNIGNKMSYTTTNPNRDFIPMNMRVGTSWNFVLDQYNSIAINLDLNKLLVPTPPVYADSVGAGGVRPILAGKDPNKGVAAAMFSSFNDAPGGYREELREIIYSTGLEYWYNNLFAFRTGYFYESPTKGNRQVFCLGFSLKYSVFSFDGSYLIPANRQQSPLNNTFRFTLGFNFAKAGNKKE